MHIVEVRPGVVAAVVGGPHAEAITSASGIGFWFNVVAQQGYGVNRMATLNLHAVLGLSAREVPLLYGPILVAGQDAAGHPAGLSGDQIKDLRGGPRCGLARQRGPAVQGGAGRAPASSYRSAVGTDGRALRRCYCRRASPIVRREMLVTALSDQLIVVYTVAFAVAIADQLSSQGGCDGTYDNWPCRTAGRKPVEGGAREGGHVATRSRRRCACGPVHHRPHRVRDQTTVTARSGANLGRHRPGDANHVGGL